MKSKEDFTETVKILLNYGADVNARNARGETAMHLASRNEFQKVIEVLVLAGCDPLAEDNDGNQAVDLTSDGDNVSLQILRHAADERDRYMSESMEIRARGFTSATQSQAALPLCVRSPSLLSMPLLMGAAPAARTLTRAASSPGLFPSPPQTAALPSQFGSGYPALQNGYLGSGVIMPQDRSHLSFNKSPAGAGIIPVETAKPGNYSNLPPAQRTVSGTGDPAYGGSFLSQITAPTGNVYGSSVTAPASMWSEDPSLPLYNSIGPSELESSIWDVTPSSSVKLPTAGQPDPETTKKKKKKDVKENRRWKVLKKKSTDSPSTPVAARKTATIHQQLVIERVPETQAPKPMSDENDDSYFDDESFDTFVESPFTDEEVLQPPPLPPRSRSSQGSSVGADSSLQRWLDEQSGLMRSRRSAAPDNKSFSSMTTVSNASELPPKLSRPPSVSSVNTVKRRPPPPVPTKTPAEKPKSHKKRSKTHLAPAEPVDVDSEDWIARQAARNQHWESIDEDQTNDGVPKSSKRKKRLKKKNQIANVDRTGDIYSNVGNTVKSNPVETSPSSSWAAASDAKVNEQKSPRSVEETLAQLSVGRPSGPLVFEKVTAQDDQIASDYLFHKSIAELTTASATNIVECVGRKMSSESSPAASSPPAYYIPVDNAVPASTKVVHPPQPVFDYPVLSSFALQAMSPNYAQQQQQQYPIGNRLQATFASSSPTEAQRPTWRNNEDDLPYRNHQQNQPVMYSVPVHQPTDPDSSPSHVIPDDQSQGSLYESLDDDKLDKCASGELDDLMPPFGLNRRTVVLTADGRLGLSVCGGNISGTFIRKVVANSVAAAAGLSPGDWIIAVNGKVVKNRSKQEVRQMIEKLAPDSARLVVDRDDDRFNLAASKNAVGDSFYVRAHFSYVPVNRARELTVKEEDVFQVSDSLPDNDVGFWVAKKVNGAVGEPEGLIPNVQKAEQIIAKQRLAASPTLNRPRGGAFMRSFRRSKQSEPSSGQDQDSLDSRQSSECGDVVPYVRVVEQSSSVRRPVVVMGLFCDSVCAMLHRDAPAVFEVPRTVIEQRRASGEEFTPSMLDVDAIRSVVNSGRHCVMLISPRAVNFLRERTELQPIVIYMSPSSKNVLKSIIQQLAPGCDKKPSFMLEEAAKFERFNAALFDAVISYKADGSWLDLLKDSIGRLQRRRTWIPFEPEDMCIPCNGSPPDLIRTTRHLRNEEHERNRLSKTTDDIPDQIQDLLSRHINITPDQPTTNANDLCTRSFDLGDRQPVLMKPPKAVSGQQGDVVLRKPPTKGRPVSSRDCVVSTIHMFTSNS